MSFCEFFNMCAVCQKRIYFVFYVGKKLFFLAGKSDRKYFPQYGTGTVSSPNVRTTDRTETSIRMTPATYPEE